MLKKNSLTLLFFLIPSLFFSQTDSLYKKPIFNINRIDNTFEINGKMDNSLWKIADSIEVNFEINPGDNAPASERTIVKALYDEEYLYFGYICYDSHPSEIRANLSERDQIFSDDYVIILIDTYNDAQKAYEIAVNPLGIQGDLMATLNGEDINFNMTWFSAAYIYDWGWTAEMKIPFKSLAFEELEETIWGFNIVRTIPRSSRTQISWTRINKNLTGFISQSGILKGLKNVQSDDVIELLPYIIGQSTGNLSDYDDPSSKFKDNGIRGRFGGGIKYSPSPNFTLDAVINPDFSQIESDAEQISVNNTFALYYDEKRPFFLVGNELFNTPVYYSRSLNNPLAAGRVIGKSGSLSYLMLSAYDRNTVFVVPGEERSNTAESNRNSYANVGRLRYDYGDEKYIGGYLMTRNLDGGHNYVLGADGTYKFWTNWLFHTQFFITHTEEINDSALVDTDRELGKSGFSAKLDGEKYWGGGIHFNLSHSQKHYFLNIENTHVNPTFQTYNGLFSNVNYRELSIYNSFRIYPENSFLDRVNINLEFELWHNYDGIIKRLELTPSINLNMKGQTYIYVKYDVMQNEKFNGKTFKNIRRGYIELNSKPFKELSFGAYASLGKFVYRADEPSIGVGHNIGGYITLKPSANLNIQFTYDRARLSDRKTDTLHYDGNIFRTTAIYQFNVEMFLRTILQYNSFEKTFKLYPLFSYKIGAFTTFYAGANGDYRSYKQEDKIVNTDQQYFIKLQYLIDL